MSKVIVLSGPSGSGKSTYANALRLLDPFATSVVSSDEVRESLYGDANDQTDHDRVFKVVDSLVDRGLENGLTVVVDATNLTRRNRESYVKAAHRFDVPVELHVFAASLQECKDRQSLRDRKVPDHVIERQCRTRDKDLGRPLFSFHREGFNSVKFVD